MKFGIVKRFYSVQWMKMKVLDQYFFEIKTPVIGLSIVENHLMV